MKSLTGLLTILTFMITAAAPVFAGSISGTIIYDGDIPKLRPLKMDADPICITHHKAGEDVLPQVLVLNENKEMANVFVHVVGGLAKKDYPTPTEPVNVTQKGCMYEPHVIGVRVGQPIKFLNPDGTLHNVHAIPKTNKEFNIAMPKFRKETTQVFDKAEFMFPVKCDVHPWMGAWISVMTHPFFSVSNSSGKYEIADLPPGEYQIEAWHEKLGKKKAAITITGDETQTIDFTFARPKK